ncbi:MAG: hypothetical protein IMF14_06635 [Proteobacteria bacterium]|nr:hypothetical protein [Pseudomonadota bacterium]
MNFALTASYRACAVLFFINLYDCNFIWHCGIRTAGELLFCQQQQKSNQKNAATTATPLKKQGFPPMQYSYHAVKKLAPVKARALRQFSRKTHGNGTASTACLRWVKVKNGALKAWRASLFLLFCFYLLNFIHLSQAIEA